MKENVSRMNFTYREYERFIEHAKNIAPIYSFKSWDGGNGIILRHDVDLNIQSAQALSKLEKKQDVTSTYFIMTSNYYYNPLFPGNSNILREIAGDGFEIGLHFDPSIYGDISIQKLRQKVVLECSILESIVDKPVKSISLHNPSLSGMYPIFKGFRNAYSKEIFSDNNYMSDSCMGFRGKDPYSFIKKAAEMPVQIVFHPMHWSEDGGDYVEYFTKYILDMADEIDDSMRVNSKYKDIIGNRRLKNDVRRAINGRD